METELLATPFFLPLLEKMHPHFDQNNQIGKSYIENTAKELHFFPEL
jgi:hypothetical protein